MGQFRRSSDAFIDGDFIPVSWGAGQFAFIRRGKTEEVLVCANRWYEQQIISVGKGFEQAEIVFGYKPQNGLVKIDGLGFTVLRKKI